jgi:hypothetical protein
MAKALKAGERERLIETLKGRFEANSRRHAGIDWAKVAARLVGAGGKLVSLFGMEATGGEPDVIGYNPKTGEVVFCDCSKESPKGRRSVCYDREALAKRKENKPKDSAVAMAAAMAIELLDEAQYRGLQELGEFDTTTSSWILTPPAIRERGGALFCDRRYGQVFTYHNGADSYYAARGFRGTVRV